MNFNDSVVNYALHFDIFISVSFLKIYVGASQTVSCTDFLFFSIFFINLM